MSRVNGDKARFHRNRKKRIVRRNRKRELLALRNQSENPNSRVKPGAANL
jgi:hypothetical protein